jgi:hypothetical protein
MALPHNILLMKRGKLVNYGVRTSFPLYGVKVLQLQVHKNENFFAFDFEFCPISLLVMHK